MNITTISTSLPNVLDGAHSVVVRVSKDGKVTTGNIARAIAFGSAEARKDIAKGLIIRWLSNGQYRPVATQIIDTMVPKAAQPFVSALIPATGSISKDTFLGLCNAVKDAIDASGKEPKGQKAWLYDIVRMIARAEDGDVVGEI